MKQSITIGLSVLAAAAVIEVALIPGVVIGGALVMAPRYIRRFLPKTKVERGRPAPSRQANHNTRVAPALVSDKAVDKALVPVGARFAVKQAIVKTITFRFIVTTLDFTTNYVVLGEVATAAGLSSIALVVGPIFYFIHEAAWNRLDPSENAAGLPVLVIPSLGAKGGSPARSGGFAIRRALIKTVTFRTMATTMDFTTNYIVVGDVVTAVGLSAAGFVLGPFVYLGHEMAWDYYARSKRVPPNPQHRSIGGSTVTIVR